MGWLKRRTAVVLAAVAVVAVVAAGVAFAVSGDRGEREQAMLADVATSLGVEQETLEQAIRDAQTSRVDAAEADGTLSDEQANRIRERIDAEQGPLLAAPGAAVTTGADAARASAKGLPLRLLRGRSISRPAS